MILVNNVLMTIPSYTLAVYSLANSILDQLAKIARNFLWVKYGNGSGLPLVSWNRITLDKFDRGLAIRNIMHLHTAYLAKNSLKFLNKDNAFGIEILEHKYGLVQHWNLKIPPKCSWFFRSLCKNLDAIKSNLCLNIVNPNYTSVLRDPWHCETPINLKPTFVNINFVDDNLHINDFIRDVN